MQGYRSTLRMMLCAATVRTVSLLSRAGSGSPTLRVGGWERAAVLGNTRWHRHNSQEPSELRDYFTKLRIIEGLREVGIAPQSVTVLDLLPVIRRGQYHYRDVPSMDILLHTCQHLEAAPARQVEVEEHEEWHGARRAIRLLYLLQILQGRVSIPQDDDGIGESRPVEMALYETGMTRIIFYE